MDLLVDQDESTKWIKVDVHSIKMSMPSSRNILFSDGKTKLRRFIYALQKSESLEIFLHGMANVNVSLPGDSLLWPGCTPLHLVVMYSKNLKNENKATQLVNLCLDEGASVQIENHLGSTPLHLAFKLEQHNIVTLLLSFLEKQSGKIANIVDIDNLSYLHIALTAKADHKDSLARKILSGERDIEATVNAAYKGKVLDNLKPGWTALHVAVDQRHYNLIELLLQKGANEICTIVRSLDAIHKHFGTSQPMPMSTFTSRLQHFILASQQLRNCVLADIGLADLHIAAWLNDDKSLERLLDEGADIEATVNPLYSKRLEKFRGCTPLHVAAIMNHSKLVEILLKRGASIFSTDAQGYTVIHRLFLTANISVADLLFASKQLQDRSCVCTGLTHLHVAVYFENAEAVERLLDKGANIEATIKYTLEGGDAERSYLSCTPLHVAMIENHLKIAKILLKRGANTNALINDYLNDRWKGNTVLHLLIKTSSSWRKLTETAVYEKLLQNGHDIDELDDEGRTVLHLMFLKKRSNNLVKILDALLSAGVDINIEDSDGESALSYAIDRRSGTVINYTIKILAIILYKMQLVGIEVSEQNETLRINAFKQLNINIEDENDFYDQIEETDKIIIGRRGLTLRSFLFETGVISLYPSLTPTDRQEIDNFLKTFTYNNSLHWKFLLKLQYRKLVARLSLVAPAGDALKKFINPSFPDLCVDIILKYLSNSTLEKLIAASRLND